MTTPATEWMGMPFGWGAIFGLANLLFGGGVLVTWLKTRADNRKVELDGDEKLRSEMWKDIAALKLAKDDQSRRLTTAETRIASQTVQIGQLRFVSALVVDELERIDPRNSIARQARLLLNAVQPDAIPNDDEIGPLAEAITKLNDVQGTRR